MGAPVVGLSVGTFVGAGVGSFVGLGVGDIDGELLGAGVSPLQLKLAQLDISSGTMGELVGDFVGPRVGFEVGEFDGGFVGLSVGDSVGSGVGFVEGDADGEVGRFMVGLSITLFAGSERTGVFVGEELGGDVEDVISSDECWFSRAELPMGCTGSNMG